MMAKYSWATGALVPFLELSLFMRSCQRRAPEHNAAAVATPHTRTRS